MFTLPALLYLKLLPSLGQCLYHLILFLIVPNKSRPPHAGVCVERLSPRWSSTGLTPFLGRPGQCVYFYATPTGRRSPTTYDLACERPHAQWIFIGIRFRTWNPPASRPRPYH
ncbi:hypothetical protein AVEN_165146-1 [Araneus ventricosus]|uniref:Uncharacterized protein n=1 Tax=Araneus ventricosus TaxID=182803 RepID=A0A4Y2B809_ARAVE|nr:hypothetical protein AVEN_165146-1 [Araneus ventricosus]